MADTPPSRKLFEDFPPVSTREWEEKILEDLKGDDYDRKLVWKTPEGARIRPYYRSEDISDDSFPESLPGDFPFIRGNRKNSNEWEIRQDILLDNIETANRSSLFILDRGITSLGFITPPHKGTSLIKTQHDLHRLLKDIYYDCIQLNFVCGFNAPHILHLLKKEAEANRIDPTHIYGAADFDPLGYLSLHGNFETNEEEDLRELQELILFVEKNLPQYRVLGINGYFFSNAGATSVQELGYSLAMTADYLNRLTDSGIPANTVSRHMQLNLGVESSYFMEIAKFRAARYLWARVLEAYDPKDKSALSVNIHAITSEWNHTIYDHYINVLRSTTESMAAVIGGADSLTVRPFTQSFSHPTRFSERIARNIQIILKEEAYLSKIADASAGSYYIENLTRYIVQESWKLFLKVEAEGSYLNALRKGIIQKDIHATSKGRKTKIATKQEVLLGTNQYANASESVSDIIDENYMFPQIPSGKTLVTPIQKTRGSMEFEILRLATEKHGRRPRVFLVPYGDPAMQKARSGFSLNFFSCAGYEIVDNTGFPSAMEGAKAALAKKADVVVLCSNDEEYALSAPEVLRILGNKALLVIAGAPRCMDDLKKEGIEYFINLRSDIIDILTSFHKKLGIL